MKHKYIHLFVGSIVIVSLCLSNVFGQNLMKIGIKTKSPSTANYSPDNKLLAIADNSNIVIYNAGNDTEIRTLEGHKKKILDIEFDGKNELLVSAGMDKSIKLWNPNTGQLLKTFTGHTKEVIGASFVKGTNHIVSVGEDMTVRLWDLTTGQQIYSKTEHTKAIRGLAISKDGKFIATAGGDKRILIWEAESGKVIHKIEAHDDWVRSLAISPDDKTLASGGDDKKVKLWELETGKLLQTFERQKGWIHDLEFSADGKYLASGSDDKSLYFYEVSTAAVNLKLEDFKGAVLDIHFSPQGQEISVVEQYNNDVQIWDVSSLNISPVFNFKDETDKTPPQIYVASPNIQENRVRYSKDIIEIKGAVIDESGVRRLRINGIETPIRENGNYLIKLPLSMGDNFVTMEVTDVNDNIALKKFIVSRKDLDGGGAYDAKEANNYLVIVGINEYQYWPALNNAVKDANDVASTLMGMYNFDFGNVTLIKDEQATRNNIYKGLRSLIERVTPKDNLLVYFSGHGFYDELLSEGYWIPVDAKLNNSGDYLSNSDILKILGNIDSQHTFLVADACFSGSLFNEQKRGYADNVEQFRSRWGLASGRLEVVSDGTQGQNSPFATNFIKFLRENPKDKVTVSELVQFVKIQVSEVSDQTPIGNPLKGAGDEGGEFVFYKKQ